MFLFLPGLQTITHSGHLDVMHNPIGLFLLAVGHFFTWIAIFSLIGGKFIVRIGKVRLG
jgi:hypothetical protein